MTSRARSGAFDLGICCFQTYKLTYNTSNLVFYHHILLFKVDLRLVAKKKKTRNDFPASGLFLNSTGNAVNVADSGQRVRLNQPLFMCKAQIRELCCPLDRTWRQLCAAFHS